MTALVLVEAIKLLRSRVGVIATGVLSGGVVMLLAVITSGIRTGNSQLIAKAGSAATLDWSGLYAQAAQVMAASSLLGFGVVLSWIFGREFTDGTIIGLFGLPASRHAIAGAKLLVFFCWSLLVSILLLAGLVVLGMVLGYGLPAGDIPLRLGALIMLSTLLVLPIALIATLTRSVFAGVASSIGLVVVAQVGVLGGAGGWLPLVTPALWAIGSMEATHPMQFGLVGIWGIGFAVVSCWSWGRLQLNR